MPTTTGYQRRTYTFGYRTSNADYTVTATSPSRTYLARQYYESGNEPRFPMTNISMRNNATGEVHYVPDMYVTAGLQIANVEAMNANQQYLVAQYGRLASQYFWHLIDNTSAANVRRPSRRRNSSRRAAPAPINTQSRPLNTPFSGETLGLVGDMNKFQRLYREVKDSETLGEFSRVAEGADPLQGFANAYVLPEGRTIGLEFEIDFPDERPEDFGTAKSALARRLYEEGLSDTDIPHGWHWRGRQQDTRGRTTGGGYVNQRNGWTVEFDRSVDSYNGQRGCEVISPIMSNSADWWDDVSTVLSIIIDLGGKVHSSHGLHVNIGARGFTEENCQNLYQTVCEYDETLIRLAHNPTVNPNGHRGRHYCAPLRDLRAGEERYAQSSTTHASIVNMGAVSTHTTNNASSRIEFRMFDATLDIGRIQRYVMIAMGLTYMASQQHEFRTIDPHHRSSYRRFVDEFQRRGRRMSGDSWRAATLPVRELIDHLQVDENAARDIIALFAESRW